MKWLYRILQSIVSKLDQILALQKQDIEIGIENQALLKQIIVLVTPPTATSFIATITGDKDMPKLSAAGDLQVADDGTFTVTLSFKDNDLVPTGVPPGLSATYTPSDATPGPSALVLAPNADTSAAAGSVNQDVIKALVAAGSPLPEGLTISVSATWTGLASPQTMVAAPPIDITPGAAGSFVATESEP